jgi:hypothetical protein
MGGDVVAGAGSAATGADGRVALAGGIASSLVRDGERRSHPISARVIANGISKGFDIM